MSADTLWPKTERMKNSRAGRRERAGGVLCVGAGADDGESPTRPYCLLVMPPVEVPAARFRGDRAPRSDSSELVVIDGGEGDPLRTQPGRAAGALLEFARQAIAAAAVGLEILVGHEFIAELPAKASAPPPINMTCGVRSKTSLARTIGFRMCCRPATAPASACGRP